MREGPDILVAFLLFLCWTLIALCVVGALLWSAV